MSTNEDAPSEMTGLEWRVAEKIAEAYFRDTGDVFDFLALDLNLQDDFHAMARAAITVIRRSAALDELGKLDGELLSQKEGE